MSNKMNTYNLKVKNIFYLLMEFIKITIIILEIIHNSFNSEQILKVMVNKFNTLNLAM